MAGELTIQMAHFVIMVGVIILAAKIAGELTERLFKAPGVLGELIIGMVIGPYALGSWINIPLIGALFPRGGIESPCMNIPCELYALSQLSAIILLFLAGLETNLRHFFSYAKVAVVIALGGIALPFVLGVSLTTVMGYADSCFEPTSLLVGTVMTATSVGVTARVLSMLHKLDTPEGIAIMGSAVMDDILGILILAGVTSIAVVGTFSAHDVAMVGFRAILFMAVLVAVGLVVSRYFERILGLFSSAESEVVIALSLCFFSAALAEVFGLAMIIGAYIVGLCLSISPAAETVKKKMAPLYHTFVPIFFVVTGMMIDLSAVTGPVLLFGIALTAAAVLGKVLGAGLPALAVGFNTTGAVRIGLGMLPRGEVALIVAGVGLSAGIIDEEIFSVAIIMTMITSILAPLLLKPSFLHKSEGAGERIKEVKFARSGSWHDTTTATGFQHTKTVGQSVAAGWLPIFLTVLEDEGFVRFSGMKSPSRTFYTYHDENNEIITISVVSVQLRNQSFIRITSTTERLDELIMTADDRYNEHINLQEI
ncbi:MAG: cation:proton antiporter [Deltaproteobacteria bacterium]|nr:cation:proton antiporter [Candidatus Zymogenaceae bacterium]